MDGGAERTLCRALLWRCGVCAYVDSRMVVEEREREIESRVEQVCSVDGCFRVDESLEVSVI